MDPVTTQPTIAPTMQDLTSTPPDGGVAQPGMETEPVDGSQGGAEQRPDESDEARGDMPKQSSLIPYPRPRLDDVVGLFQNHERMKALADEHQPKVKVPVKPVVEDDAEVPVPEAIERKQAVGLYQGPRHLGMRRHITEADINMELQV
jgi:hypothetical protein